NGSGFQRFMFPSNVAKNATLRMGHPEGWGTRQSYPFESLRSIGRSSLQQLLSSPQTRFGTAEHDGKSLSELVMLLAGMGSLCMRLAAVGRQGNARMPASAAAVPRWFEEQRA